MSHPTDIEHSFLLPVWLLAVTLGGGQTKDSSIDMADEAQRGEAVSLSSWD